MLLKASLCSLFNFEANLHPQIWVCTHVHCDIRGLHNAYYYEVFGVYLLIKLVT